MIESIQQKSLKERQEIEKSSKKSCLATSKTKEEARELLGKFNPSLQSKCYANPIRCVKGSAPTLAVVRRDYGEQVAVDWLAIELNDYQNFVGVKEEGKATFDVVSELSKMILGRYYYLKLSEIMLFLQKLKYGDYGEMYGRIDAVRILRALRLFITDRNEIIDRHEQKENSRKRIEAKKNAISYQEYLAMKAKKENKTI